MSCNSKSNEPEATISDKLKPLDNFEISQEASAFPDSYWENPVLGANEAETKLNIVKKFDNLLVFHANDTMNLKETYIATLALARNAALDPLIQSVLKESGASDDNVLVDSTIQLGKRIRADLRDVSPRDDKSFIIEPFGTDEQNLDKTKEKYWQWNIEPLKEGQHKLILSVQVIKGDDDKMNLPARNIPVIIFAKKVSFAGKMGNFFSNYWQWIITGILTPIFIALLTTRLKRKGEEKK